MLTSIVLFSDGVVEGGKMEGIGVRRCFIGNYLLVHALHYDAHLVALFLQAHTGHWLVTNYN